MFVLGAALIGLLAGPTLGKRDMELVCDNLSHLFLGLQSAIPVVGEFPAGVTSGGLQYPAGLLLIDSVKPVKGLCEYRTAENGITHYKFNLQANLTIILPNFPYKGKSGDLMVKVHDLWFYMQYQVSGDEEVQLTPTEVMILPVGMNVVMTFGRQPEQDISDIAEESIRPTIADIAKKFLEKDLQFRGSRSEYDPSGAAHSALKTLFQLYMYTLHVRGTPTPQPDLTTTTL